MHRRDFLKLGAILLLNPTELFGSQNKAETVLDVAYEELFTKTLSPVGLGMTYSDNYCGEGYNRFNGVILGNPVNSINIIGKKRKQTTYSGKFHTYRLRVSALSNPTDLCVFVYKDAQAFGVSGGTDILCSLDQSGPQTYLILEKTQDQIEAEYVINGSRERATLPDASKLKADKIYRKSVELATPVLVKCVKTVYIPCE